MATTAIGGDRGQTGAAGSAIERYPDAVFIRDDAKFYFGDGGDFSIHYDSTSDLILIQPSFEKTLSDVDPAISDALFLVSDVTSGKYLLAVSGG